MNNENLKPPESSRKARELGKLGGIESGKSKRRKRALKEVIAELLTMPVTNKDAIEKFVQFFPELEEESINYISYAFLRVIQDLINSSTKPLERIKIIEFLRDTIDGKPIEQVRIDETKQEEYELDKKLAQLSTEELMALAYGFDRQEETND